MNAITVRAEAMANHHESDSSTPLLTIPEAAQQAEVSIATIKSWMAAGRLPSVRRDRRRIAPAALAVAKAQYHLGEVVPVWRRERRRVGRRLRQLREAAGLSQLALAARTGLAHETICTLERGRRAPLAETVRQLAHGLGIDPARFIAEEPGGLTLLTVADAAARLEVPASRVQTWLKQGELPGHKVSGQWRVSAIAVADLARSGRLRGESRRLDPRYRG
jgi:excisionase family DNA binding protein